MRRCAHDRDEWLVCTIAYAAANEYDEEYGDDDDDYGDDDDFV